MRMTHTKTLDTHRARTDEPSPGCRAQRSWGHRPLSLSAQGISLPRCIPTIMGLQGDTTRPSRASPIGSRNPRQDATKEWLISRQQRLSYGLACALPLAVSVAWVVSLFAGTGTPLGALLRPLLIVALAAVGIQILAILYCVLSSSAAWQPPRSPALLWRSGLSRSAFWH